jgi:hypothetical protein
MANKLIMILLLCIAAAMAFPAFAPKPKTEDMACDKYKCAPSGAIVDYSTCGYYETDTYYLVPCQNQPHNLTFCQATDPDSFNMTCTANPTSNEIAFPGEICTNLTKCFTGNCSSTNHRCTGLSAGATCGSDAQCAPGLFCNDEVCGAQIPAGMTGCYSSYDCVNSASCNMTRLGLGNCVRYFSVPEGGIVSDCEENTSFMCSSGSCKPFGKKSLATCVKSIRSMAYVPKTCDNSGDCIGQTDSDYVEGKCSCGVNGEGSAFCELFPGDPAGIHLRSLYTEFIQKGYNGVCNTARRYSTECILSSNYPKKEELAIAALYYEFFPQLQNNDVCVKSIFNHQYWDLGSAAALMASVVILLA